MLALAVWLAFQPQSIIYSETRESTACCTVSKIDCGVGFAMVFAGRFDPGVPGASHSRPTASSTDGRGSPRCSASPSGRCARLRRAPLRQGAAETDPYRTPRPAEGRPRRRRADVARRRPTDPRQISSTLRPELGWTRRPDEPPKVSRHTVVGSVRSPRSGSPTAHQRAIGTNCPVASATTVPTGLPAARSSIRSREPRRSPVPAGSPGCTPGGSSHGTLISISIRKAMNR
jgi:hypothetical protein